MGLLCRRFMSLARVEVSPVTSNPDFRCRFFRDFSVIISEHVVRPARNVEVMSHFVITESGIVLNRTAAADGRVPLAAWDIGSAQTTHFLSTQPTTSPRIATGNPTAHNFQGLLSFRSSELETTHAIGVPSYKLHAERATSMQESGCWVPEKTTTRF